MAAVIRENPRAPWLAVSVVCFGAFMGQLDAVTRCRRFIGLLVGGLASMAGRIGTTFGISLMALDWHLGSIVIRPAILGTLGQNRHGPRSPCSPS